MFLDYWMIGIFIIVAGLWSERRYKSGILAGVGTTIEVFKERNFIKVDEKGHLVPYK